MATPKGQVFDTAQFFRRTQDYFNTSLAILQVDKIQTPQQVGELLKKKPPADQSARAMGIYRRQIQRFERKWQQLPYGLQAIRFAAGMFKALMQAEGNKSLIQTAQVSDEKIHEIIEEPIESSNRRKLTKKGVVTLLLKNKPEKGVGFEAIKGTHEYRDPSKQRSGDPIHQGAKAKFKRYAITQLDIAGKKYSAGRKGTQYEGLGLEPPLSELPNRARVSAKSQYVAFRRIGYPGRSVPDKITNKIAFPLHFFIFNQDNIKKKIIKKCRDVVVGVYTDYQKGTTAVLVDGAKELKRELI